MTTAETVIVGGGPAGSATACSLAATGHDVLLIERTARASHKVCGEFLSIETQVELRRLGVEPLTLGAVPIDHITLHSADRFVTAPLPFRALSLSRLQLDDALLRSAHQRGARLLRGVAVTSVAFDGATWSVFCDQGDTVRCRNLVVATGKLGLRGIDDDRDASLVGSKIHLRLSSDMRREIERHVELYFLDGGYVGLEPIEDDMANICVLLPSTAMSRIGPGWLALRNYLESAAPTLAKRLINAEPLWERPKAVVCPSGGHIHREQQAAIYRVGDRIAHIPPLTGDGLAIALCSAALAADHIRLGLSPDAYLAATHKLTAHPIRLASLVSAAAKYPFSRSLLFNAAAYAPGLIATMVRQTRLKPPAAGL